MPQLLGTAQYREVRAAIAPDLADDIGAIPDDVIAQDVYAGSAVREVASLDPLLGTRVDDEFRRVQSAAVLLCAARLAPRVAEIIRENIGTYGVTMAQRDFAKIGENCRYEAYRLLGMNQPEVDPASTYRPTAFAVFTRRRGDVSVGTTSCTGSDW